jgi:hypothetical protein
MEKIHSEVGWSVLYKPTRLNRVLSIIQVFCIFSDFLFRFHQHLIRGLNPFTFNVITNLAEFQPAILLLFFPLSHLFFVPFLLILTPFILTEFFYDLILSAYCFVTLLVALGFI